MIKTFSFLLLVTTFLNANNAQELFDTKCASCHVTTHPSKLDKSKLTAPPAFGIMKHVKEAFNADREETIAFIKEYVMNPSKEMAKCRPHAIERFGLMPSQKGLLNEEELSLIANYMFDTFGKGKSCKN